MQPHLHVSSWTKFVAAARESAARAIVAAAAPAQVSEGGLCTESCAPIPGACDGSADEAVG